MQKADFNAKCVEQEERMAMMPRYQAGTMMGPGMVQMSAVAQPMVSRSMVSVTAPPVSNAQGRNCKISPIMLLETTKTCMIEAKKVCAAKY